MPITLDGTNGITTNSGTVISASTIGVGGATPSTSGAGITFPATQSASTDANTLDDYEEGTFTPSFSFNGGGSVTYGERTASYTKIGRVVNCTIALTVSATSSPTGVTSVTGLPFTVASGERFVSAISVSLNRNFNSAFSITGYCDNNTTNIILQKNATNQDYIGLAGADFKAGTALYFSITYQSN